MQKYKKVYIDHFGYDTDSFIPSELSGKPAVNIHHIHLKGMGGSKTKDNIENLMAMTFSEHEQAHYRREPWLSPEELQEIHNNFLERHG